MPSVTELLRGIIDISYAGHPDGRTDRLESIKRLAEAALDKHMAEKAAQAERRAEKLKAKLEEHDAKTKAEEAKQPGDAQ